MNFINIADFFNHQLDCWKLASDNFEALRKVETRTFMFGDFPLIVQWNPARKRSTGAKVDSKSISERTCFLCREHRPEEQYYDDSIVKGYDFLVNPYPIFDHHFTISSIAHRHQDEIDFRQMADFAINHPELVTFYNGSASGASAPDHLHFQAGNKDFLPICNYVNHDIDRVDSRFFPYVVRRYPELPMKFIHMTIPTSDIDRYDDCCRLINQLCEKPSMRNIVMFTNNSEHLEVLIFPRKSHRPSCYFATGEQHIMVSPGAVDMAGVMILPQEEDFDKITKEDIIKIYSEVSLSDSEINTIYDNLNRL